MSSSTSNSSPSTSSPTRSKPKICFNPHCKEPLPDPPPARRLGWRLRSGQFAQLCLRCSYAFEEGSFCEAFHSDDTGWRKCESCGKRVHCGCVASASTYLLVDDGGVECIMCARKSLAEASNRMMPSSLYTHQPGSERRELNCQSIQGPLSGLWRQSPQMWNLTSIQPDLQQRLSLEFGRPKIIEKLVPGFRHSFAVYEKKNEELVNRITPSRLTNSPINSRCFTGSVALGSSPTLAKYHKEEGNADIIHDSNNLMGDNDPGSRRSGIRDPCSTGSLFVNLEDDPCGKSQPSSSTKEPKSSLQFGVAPPFPSTNASKDPAKFHLNQPLSQVVVPFSQQSHPQGKLHADLQSQTHKGRHRVDSRIENQSFSRTFSSTTDEELQQTSADPKSVITPLFEKMLSASDVGRYGRLVLPKKCAEAYFPTILHPNGLPLKVQDASGKEWVFQFHFYPNSNSRTYVLEGITPCIQAMQLQAGDRVTFGRIDPEGKLVIGFRKATSASADKETQAHQSGNEFPIPPDDTKKNLAVETSSNLALQANKVSTEMKTLIKIQEDRLSSQFTESSFTQKDELSARRSHGFVKRKSDTLGSKIKRLRMKNEDSMELKLTWEEAQKFLCAPRGQDPSVVVIEGHEFEEYQDAPVLGRHKYFTTHQSGESNLWAQCEDCSKWRKLPTDACLKFRWICSDNIWDADRSSCSAAQELNVDQLANLISFKTGTSRKVAVEGKMGNTEGSDGHDTLPNLATLGEGQNNLNTTRHPRHKLGCTCIICTQPPSGKGPKHPSSCTCNVCLKCRFRTLVLRREKRQSENKDVKKKQLLPANTDTSQHSKSNSTLGDGGNSIPIVLEPNDGTVNITQRSKTLSSPLKAQQIDLNIRPARDEELLPDMKMGVDKTNIPLGCMIDSSEGQSAVCW